MLLLQLQLIATIIAVIVEFGIGAAVPARPHRRLRAELTSAARQITRALLEAGRRQRALWDRYHRRLHYWPPDER